MRKDLLVILIVVITIVFIGLVGMNMRTQHQLRALVAANSGQGSVVDDSTSTNSDSVETTNTSQNTGTKQTVSRVNWSTVPVSTIARLIVNSGFISNLGTEGLRLVDTIDLTGDGVSEGIYQLPYSESEVIMISTKDGYKMAEMRDSTENYPASLFSAGRVQSISGYKMIPGKGFITVSGTGDPVDMNNPDSEMIWSCERSTYHWNGSVFALVSKKTTQEQRSCPL